MGDYTLTFPIMLAENGILVHSRILRTFFLIADSYKRKSATDENLMVQNYTDQTFFLKLSKIHFISNSSLVQLLKKKKS